MAALAVLGGCGGFEKAEADDENEGGPCATGTTKSPTAQAGLPEKKADSPERTVRLTGDFSIFK